jgi:hypothetical protein
LIKKLLKKLRLIWTNKESNSSKELYQAKLKKLLMEKEKFNSRMLKLEMLEEKKNLRQ